MWKQFFNSFIFFFLSYAHHLVDTMKKGEHDFGAAFDGDGVSVLHFNRVFSTVVLCEVLKPQ